MKVHLICVGKLKEAYLSSAVAEYSKRLGGFCTLTITEVTDEKTPDNPSANLCAMIKNKEGEKILSKINQRDFVIALDLQGAELSSEALAKFMGDKMVEGISTIAFVIGGSLGLGDDVLARSDYRLCFSKMTFPHQLMRVILLEQVYRGFKILNNEPYHK